MAEALTPTSYVVLGLLATRGPSTPYELKRIVARSIGNFWSFPHTQLYREPVRLTALGLVREEREEGGRRRRRFTITPEGTRALEAWLERPPGGQPEVRDPGLLQLAFAEVATPAQRRRLAEGQLERHRETLATYEAIERAALDCAPGDPARWRFLTLRMGLLYERASVDFWSAVLAEASAPVSGRRRTRSGTTPRSRA